MNLEGGKEMREIDRLIGSWTGSGGTLPELIEELKTDRGRELAEVYDVPEAEVAQLLDVAGLVDEFLQRVTEEEEEHPLEDRRTWVRRTARELAEYVDALKEAQTQRGTLELAARGRRELEEPFAGQLRDWMAGGGSIQMWFELNSDIVGPPGQYNLVPFVETEAEWARRVMEEYDGQ
jgi:hypothetical protein